VVGETKWQEGVSLFAKPFIMAAVRYFDCARIEAARDWLRLDEPGRAGKEST